MSPVLVIGATGLLGNDLARLLHERGEQVRALVRSPAKAADVVPAGIALVPGDLTDPASLARAVTGCDLVFHAGGFPEQWVRDEQIFDQVNAQGTSNVLAAARDAGVRRVVYTGTMNDFVGQAGRSFDERELGPGPEDTPYSRSKRAAMQAVTRAQADGLDVVSLHPAALYGPGPATSPGLNQFFSRVYRRRLPLLVPGGLAVVSAGDAALGHLLAADHAPPNARYLLSESYQTMTAMARAVVAHRGGRVIPPVLPLPVAVRLAAASEVIANRLNIAPLVPRGQLALMQWGAVPDATRAYEQLGWTPQPFAEGLEETLAFLHPQPRSRISQRTGHRQ